MGCTTSAVSDLDHRKLEKINVGGVDSNGSNISSAMTSKLSSIRSARRIDSTDSDSKSAAKTDRIGRGSALHGPNQNVYFSSEVSVEVIDQSSKAFAPKPSIPDSGNSDDFVRMPSLLEIISKSSKPNSQCLSGKLSSRSNDTTVANTSAKTLKTDNLNNDMSANLKTLEPGALDYDVLKAIFKILDVDAVNKDATLAGKTTSEALEAQSPHSDEDLKVKTNLQTLPPESLAQGDDTPSTTASISGWGSPPRGESVESEDFQYGYSSSRGSHGSHMEMVTEARIQAPVGDSDKHEIEIPDQGPVTPCHRSSNSTHIESFRDEVGSSGSIQSTLANNCEDCSKLSQDPKITLELPRPSLTEEDTMQPDKSTPRFGRGSSRADFMIPSSLRATITV